MKVRNSVSINVVVITAFAACIVISNWAMLHLGKPHGAGQPHTVPVGFGLHAPSGVIFAGAMLTFRDAVHERLGSLRTFGVILLSTPLTTLAASSGLAIASTVAFVFAEVGDLAVYAWLRRKGRFLAVVGSNLISALVDSVIFLSVAFGVTSAVDSSAAMVVGKFESSMAALVLLEAASRMRLSKPNRTRAF